jgi:hypothetical protein
MRTRLRISLGLLAVVALVGGCSRDFSDSSNHRSLMSPFAPGGVSAFKPDSIPGGPPPPKPPPPPIQAVVFLGADSAAAGQTVNTYWQLGNPNHSAFTTQWTLTGPAWPGLPIQGTATLAALSTQPLTVQVTVPDSAAAGFYSVRMAVTQKRGGDATADGGIRVFGSPPDSLRSTPTR